MKRLLERARSWPRLVLVLACALVYGTLGLGFYERGLFYYYNALFNGDGPRVVRDLTEFHAPHLRTTVHPLVPLLALPFGVPLAAILRSPELAALALVVLAGSLAVVAAYSLFRTLTSEAEARALALIYAASSSSLVLFSQPETFAFSALGIVLTAYAVRRGTSLAGRVGAALLLAGSLVTNVVHLLAAPLLAPGDDLRAKIRRGAEFVGVTLAALAALTWLEVRVVPNTLSFFRRGTVTNETQYFAPLSSFGALGTRLTDLALHFTSYAFVAPAPRFWKPLDEAIDRVTFLEAWRHGFVGYGAVATAITLAWLALLGWTLLLHVTAGRRRSETLSVTAVLAAHFGLFVVYGDDLLLYSPLWVIEIVLAVALALSYARETGRARPPVSALLALGVALLLQNALVFAQVQAHYAPPALCHFPGKPCPDSEPLRFLRAAGAPRPSFVPPSAELTGRAELSAEMRRRPRDHWSARAAHVLVGEPGGPLSDKAYYEVGGNLSPAMGSFGVSYAELDAGGRLVSASSDAAESGFDERWQFSDGRPAVVSTTAARSVRTRFAGPGHAVIDVEPRRAREVVLLRSAGPAGGPLWHVELKEPGVLRLNDAWTLRVTPAPRVALGLEVDGLEPEPFAAVEVFDVRGWAFARLELEQPTSLELVRDGAPRAEPWPAAPSDALALRIPDPKFRALLDASWLHLRSGITDDQVRPGDPAHYALPWLRDGAYVVAALARTGDAELVRRIVPEFSQHDFFGGFGSEADAPGYALWALDQATAVLDPEPFVANIWPAVERKVALIERMRRGPVRAPPEGPLLPAYEHDPDVGRVADAPRQGCIEGHMDHQVPLFFVNAVSFQGLRSAARLAELRDDASQATAWRSLAADLARACAPFAVDPNERSAARTAISAIWPTFFASDGDDALRAGLEQHWQQSFGADGPKTMPPWTYFTVAEAHQWLYLGRPERARATLGWFFEHDPLRGLLAFPEDHGQPSGLWRRYRGWPRDEPIVPHYWTAAELVLLELDMLAFEDERTTPPTIVVGAGLERAWVEAGQVAFTGLRTRSSRVSLATDGGGLHVRVEARTPLRVVVSPHLRGIRAEIAQ